MSLQSDNPIVLVVDDSPDSLGMINMALNQAGYTVLVSLNGQQALDIAKQIKPNVVLMDAIMPIMDGFECSKKMRLVLPVTPIIFMTGLTEVEHTVKAFENGGNDYIHKPINPEELLARIKVHVNNANMINNARTALDTAKQYVLAINNNGEILWATPETRELLHDRIPAFMENENSQATSLKALLGADVPRKDLVIQGVQNPVTIRYFKQVNSNEHLLRIVGSGAIPDASILEKVLPVTKREAEVLLWVAHGKTNREIGEILSLSPRTINKHLEQIFVKIKVDNRTAATSLAIQALLGLPI